MRTSAVSPVSLDQHIAWWRDAGLISTEQAEAITEQERRWATQAAQAAPAGVAGGRSHAGEPTPGRLPLVVEALGYIGGVLSLVGAVLLLSRPHSRRLRPPPPRHSPRFLLLLCCRLLPRQ